MVQVEVEVDVVVEVEVHDLSPVSPQPPSLCATGAWFIGFNK